jgi:hypothetical protein
MRLAMTNKIRISELSEKEIERLSKSKGFNRFGPVKCDDCDCEGFFRRKVFKVKGYCDIGDDDSQNLLRHHMKEQYGLDNIHFRSVDNTDYIDTAFCPKCDSNKVIFDINLDEEMFDEIARRCNVSKDTCKKEIQKIHERLTRKSVAPFGGKTIH